MAQMLKKPTNRKGVRKRVNILFCIDELNIGGTEKQVLAIIERLDRDKFQPYLVCLRPSDYFFQCDVRCPKKILYLESIASFNGLVKFVQFVLYLRKKRINIVQTFFFDSTVFGVLAGKLAGVNKVISSRRDMGFWYTEKLLMILRFVNMLTDRILVNSQAIKNNVISKENVKGEKVDVIYNGIDLAPFAIEYDIDRMKAGFKIPMSDKIVGIVANLNRQVKRIDLFVCAAAQVLRKNKHVSFIIVGDGHLREQLYRQTRDLNVAHKVHFVGSVNNVVPYLKLMDIGVLTSESEGFSNSILEYVASGLPVICYESGGNGELITNNVNGFLGKPSSVAFLTESILSLINGSIETIRQANILVIREYSWDNIIFEIEKYYLN